MFKPMLLALLCIACLPILTAAQSDPIYIEEFASMEGKEFKQLVPYAQDGNWGYMEAVTKKIMCPPLFKEAYFGTSCLRVIMQDGKKPSSKKAVNRAKSG